MIFCKPTYEQMTPAEFQEETIQLFNIRKELEQAILILNAFDKNKVTDISEKQRQVIFAEYVMQKVLDISFFEPGKKTACISIKPQILKNGSIDLELSLTIGNRQIRKKDIALELKYLRKNLLIHTQQMRIYYKHMRKCQNWPDIYRR